MYISYTVYIDIIDRLEQKTKKANKSTCSTDRRNINMGQKLSEANQQKFLHFYGTEDVENGLVS
jgi:hypothetical protein